MTSAALVDEWKGVARLWHDLADVDKRALLDDFALGYCYHSGKIENDAITLHDTREYFERGAVVSYTGDVRTLFEIANLKTSWEWARELAKPGLVVDEALVLEAHALLCRGTYDETRWARGERPGTYKVFDYGVGVDGAVGYPPDAVEDAVQALLAEVRGAGGSDANAFAAAAWLHARLVEIHPFADGNGRTARLLMNALLLSADLPPLCIREEDRMAYYGALDALHLDDDFEPFLEFCRAETLEVWPQRLARLQQPSLAPKDEESDGRQVHRGVPRRGL